MGRECSLHAEQEEFIQDFGRKIKMSISLGRRTSRWLDNIKINKILWYGLD
jgi:hypothetical protein